VKAKGNTYDVYVGPADFAQKFGVAFAKGNEIRVLGSKMKFEDADVILAREITKGKLARGPGGRFVEDTTFYIRDDGGAFLIWNDATQ